MANRHMKVFNITIIKKVQIQTTKIYLTPNKMAIIYNI